MKNSRPLLFAALLSAFALSAHAGPGTFDTASTLVNGGVTADRAFDGQRSGANSYVSYSGASGSSAAPAKKEEKGMMAGVSEFLTKKENKPLVATASLALLAIPIGMWIGGIALTPFVGAAMAVTASLGLAGLLLSVGLFS